MSGKSFNKIYQKGKEKSIFEGDVEIRGNFRTPIIDKILVEIERIKKTIGKVKSQKE